MAAFTKQQVLEATGGQLLVAGPENLFCGISTDTRTLQPGELFVAIHGENSNGHDYLDAAKAKGAAGALVAEEVPGVQRRHLNCGEWTIIEVTDTTYALGMLAQAHRRRFSLPVIGITGSAGKTTTKELTAAILAQGHCVLKTEANFNNEFGLPRTLFLLTEAHQAAVVEFGMRGRGQIGYLTTLAEPTIGVITNVGLTHLELLGTAEAIALAKAELLDEMPACSLAVIPAGGPFAALLRAHAQGPVLTFGESDDADVRAGDVQLEADGCARFTLHAPGVSCAVRVGVPGRHQVWNALAAAAAALAAGATPGEVQAGLAGCATITGRMCVTVAPRDFTVIDDTYNANPDAMRATLQSLAEMRGGKKVAILGDMLELGAAEVAQHREIGRLAMALGIDAVLAVGERAQDYVAGAADARARWCPDHAAAVDAALALLAPGDCVLVKGSRSMHMETVVEALLAAQ